MLLHTHTRTPTAAMIANNNNGNNGDDDGIASASASEGGGGGASSDPMDGRSVYFGEKNHCQKRSSPNIIAKQSLSKQSPNSRQNNRTPNMTTTPDEPWIAKMLAMRHSAVQEYDQINNEV